MSFPEEGLEVEAYLLQGLAGGVLRAVQEEPERPEGCPAGEFRAEGAFLVALFGRGFEVLALDGSLFFRADLDRPPL